MNSTPRVLMLGWEYPPFLAGGLGTACQGLVNALKEYADITLIVPRFDERYAEDRLRILGLNHDEARYLDMTGPAPQTSLKRYFVDAQLDFSPYPVGISFEVAEEQRLLEQDEREPLFTSGDPYGPNILAKVYRFREMAVELALQQDFDVIHAHDWITYPAALAIKELTGKPLVVHVHSLETDRIGENHDFSGNAVYEIERNGMLKADCVIPVSEYTKRCAIRLYDIPEEKIFPVYNAIDLNPAYRVDKPTDVKTVLFLGRVTFQKGPEFMVETAMKLLTRYRKVRFVVAGAGDKLDLLKTMVKQHDLADKFIFTGFLPRPAVRDLLAQTDVYFMPSVSEPFGLSALEAAQFDVPVIVSAQSGVAEVLPNSLQADFWDTDRFANYIYALLNYEGLRQDVVQNTRSDMRSISWNEAAQDVMEIYEALLS